MPTDARCGVWLGPFRTQLGARQVGEPGCPTSAVTTPRKDMVLHVGLAPKAVCRERPGTGIVGGCGPPAQSGGTDAPLCVTTTQLTRRWSHASRDRHPRVAAPGWTPGHVVGVWPSHPDFWSARCRSRPQVMDRETEAREAPPSSSRPAPRPVSARTGSFWGVCAQVQVRLERLRGSLGVCAGGHRPLKY